MNEIEKNYLNILHAFNTYLNDDNLLETNNKYHVTIDDIHDAIIFEDEKKGCIKLDQSPGFYVQSAKYMQLTKHRKNERNKIKNDIINDEYLYNADFTHLNYNLNDDENQLLNEILRKIPAYKSAFSRRARKKIFESIKQKVLKI